MAKSKQINDALGYATGGQGPERNSGSWIKLSYYGDLIEVIHQDLLELQRLERRSLFRKIFGLNPRPIGEA